MNRKVITDFLLERKSVRKFDSTVEISNETIYSILQLATTAPSSNNFQPWKIIVIKNKAIQKKLRELSANQEQVETASAVFLLLGDKSAYDYSNLIKLNLDHKIIDENSIQQFTQTLDTYFSLHPEDREVEGLKLDVGLFAMNLMHVVRAFNYDSVPMRGVFFNEVKELLSIDDQLVPIMMLPVGVALEQGYSKVRYDIRKATTILE